MQTQQDRLDWNSYEAQLLAVLRKCLSIAESHNCKLAPHFLLFVGHHSTDTTNNTSRLPKQKWSHRLALFAKFANLKSLYANDGKKDSPNIKWLTCRMDFYLLFTLYLSLHCKTLCHNKSIELIAFSSNVAKSLYFTSRKR